MAGQVEFELVSPERLLLSEPVDMVVVPGAEGDFGVLPGHAPLISGIRTGVIATYEDGRIGRRIFVSGGFAEVTPERCTVLSTESVNLDDMDESAARQRLDAAERNLNDAASDGEREKCEKALEVARALVVACA